MKVVCLGCRHEIPEGEYDCSKDECICDCFTQFHAKYPEAKAE